MGFLRKNYKWINSKPYAIYINSSTFARFQENPPSGSFLGPSQNTVVVTIEIYRKLLFSALQNGWKRLHSDFPQIVIYDNEYHLLPYV